MSEIAKKIDEVIKLSLVPLLRSKGFKKKGRNFYREFENRIELINVQASKWNEGGEGQFTVNLGVYFPEVANIIDAIPFKGVPKEYDCTVQKRIGHLMPSGCDHWWKIEPSINIEELATDLKTTIEKYGIPWVARMADLNEIKEEVRNDNRAFVSAGIALLQGDKSQAREYLSLAYKQQPLAAERAKAWGIKHELIEA